MEVARLPSRRAVRKLTAIALLLLFAPPLWVAPAATASPGGGWSTPVDLSSSGYAYAYDVCSDRLGNAMVVWTDWSAGVYLAFARRFVNGLGWQPEEQIDPSGSDAYGISVSCDPMGDAFAAWYSWNGSAYTAVAARYTADWGWGGPRTLSPMNFNTYEVETAMDGAGAGYVVASAWNGSGYEYRATRMDSNGTMGATIRIDNSSNANYDVRIAASAAPGVIIVWRQYNGTNTDLLSIRHSGTAWQSRLQVETKGGDIDFPVVGLDDAGNALVVFRQNVFSTYTWYATSTPYSGWTAQQYVGTGDAGGALAVMPGGQAVYVTYHWNGSAYVYAAFRYWPGVGFDAPIFGTEPVISYPIVATNAKGQVLVSSFVYIGALYLAKVQFFSGSQWTPTYFVDTNGTTDNNYQAVGAVLADGRAIALWMRYDSAYTYWYARAALYSAVDTTPPAVKITYPFNGGTTSSGYMWTTGWAEPGASVSVNGFEAATDARGYFEVNIPLVPGNHWLQAHAIDAAGNSAWSNSVYVADADQQDLIDAHNAQAGRSGWQDPIQLDPVKYSGAWWPRVGIDRYGNGAMVYYDWVNGANHAYVSLYFNATGWTVPSMLQTEDGNLWGAPRMAFDDGGNLTVVFCTYAYDGSWAHVYATIYTRNYGWAGTYRIDSAERFAFWPDVAVDNQMRHFFVWQQRDEITANYSIWSRYLNTSGYFFGGHQRIAQPLGSNDVPRIAFDGAGLGYVSYRSWNGTQSNLSLSRWNGASWNGSQALQVVPGDQWNHPLAADRGGNVTIASRTWNGTQQNISAGRFWANGSWSPNQLVWGNSWDWDPEVIADPSGRAFVASTATVNGSATAFVGVGQPGQPVSAGVQLEGTLSNEAGGPKLSTGRGGSPVRVHFDEYYNGMWNPQMREYNAGNQTWGAIIQLGPGIQGGHIPDVAPMPDGGYMVVYIEDNTTLGIGQAVARRFMPLDTTAPNLTITAPLTGATFGVAFADVRGNTEPGARVWVNNVEAVVAPNGTFAAIVPLTNGSNTITAQARDINGNLQNRSVTVTFADPALALISNLTAQNLALQAAFLAANSSLWAALAGQNASLLGQLAAQNASLAAAIASGDAALLAQLLAQNASLAAAISTGDAALVAALTAQNATLAAAIAAGDAALLANLIAQNASLLNVIGSVNASLLASLAAQNSSLLATIAATNATLLAQLAAQNASVAAALSNLNATLLAELASQDAELTQLIANTNATLLAQLAAQNDALTDLIASTNSSLLASLAAQNGDLLARIASTNSSLLASLAAQNSDLLALIASTNSTLLAQLASQNATLWAKLTADNGALWNSLNATNGVNSNQNTTLAATQADVDAAQAQAASASMMGMVGALLGVAGIAVAAVAILLSRKRPPPSMEGTAAPPEVGHVEVVDVAPTARAPAPEAAHGASHGHSMGSEGELTSAEA